NPKAPSILSKVHELPLLDRVPACRGVGWARSTDFQPSACWQGEGVHFVDERQQLRGNRGQAAATQPIIFGNAPCLKARSKSYWIRASDSSTRERTKTCFSIPRPCKASASKNCERDKRFRTLRAGDQRVLAPKMSNWRRLSVWLYGCGDVGTWADA